MIALALLVACAPPRPPPPAGRPPAAEVRFRPDPVHGPDPVLEAVPGATWDRGLARACAELAAASTDRRARITPAAAALALARAGYPAPARFARELNGGAHPERLLAEVARAAAERDQPVDVASCSRRYANGDVLWIAAVAHRPVLLDPLPRDIPLDGAVGVGLEVLDRGSADPLARLPDPVLFLATPDLAVHRWPIDPDHTRWVDGFHVPGEARFEVVARSRRATQVVLTFSLFVDAEPPGLGPLPPAPEAPADPVAATARLYADLDALRADAGLPPLVRFAPFEPLAREHAAWMAATGRLDHVLPGVTPGVAARAARRFHPRAHHREDLAVALDAAEATELVRLSPGHLANLLCTDCTHVSIGVALEPVLDRLPRLFVVWELLDFPNGEPRAVHLADIPAGPEPSR